MATLDLILDVAFLIGWFGISLYVLLNVYKNEWSAIKKRPFRSVLLTVLWFFIAPLKIIEVGLEESFPR